jgi:outer membrane protein OmpA-like peptidoglycan-associated protein
MKQLALLCALTSLIGLTGCKKKVKKVRPVEIEVAGTYEPGKEMLYNKELESFVLEEDTDPFGSDDARATISLLDDASDADQESSDGFRTIYFDFDKANLRQDQQEALKANLQLARELEKQGKLISIAGHSCTITKSEAYNMHLSEKRAQALADYLVAHGIDRSAIRTVGYGATKATVRTGNKKQQAVNRRDTIIATTHA